MKSAVTLCLIPEAAGGPFIFWHDIEGACAKAAELGFNAVEVFPPDTDFRDRDKVREALAKHKLACSAFGSGAGWVKHKLLLTSPDPAIRQKAKNFVRDIITLAAGFGAPTIVGSMQGKVEPGGDRAAVLSLFREAIDELAAHAVSLQQTLLIEPLNRYETNLLNTVQQSLDFLATLKAKNVKLLLDLFHMNIEEADIPASIRLAANAVGHIHFVDSNRRAAGLGHIDFPPIIRALRDIGYQGFLSAEGLPLPTSDQAAAQTIRAFKELTR